MEWNISLPLLRSQVPPPRINTTNSNPPSRLQVQPEPRRDDDHPSQPVPVLPVPASPTLIIPPSPLTPKTLKYISPSRLGAPGPDLPDPFPRVNQTLFPLPCPAPAGARPVGWTARIGNVAKPMHTARLFRSRGVFGGWGAGPVWGASNTRFGAWR